MSTVHKNPWLGVGVYHGHLSLYNVEIAGSATGVSADAISLISTAGQYVRIQDNQLGVRLGLHCVGQHGSALPILSNNATDFDIDPSSTW